MRQLATRTEQGPRRAAAAVLALISATGLLLGCGQQRSVAAYCQVFYGNGAQLRQQWQAQNGNGSNLIGALGTVLGAPQQLANFLGQLDAVAPDSIEPDVHQLQQTAQQEADSMKSGNVLQSLFGGLISGIGSQPAANRVDQWTLSNCGPPPP